MRPCNNGDERASAAWFKAPATRRLAPPRLILKGPVSLSDVGGFVRNGIHLPLYGAFFRVSGIG
jgi:hypothetical protein